MHAHNKYMKFTDNQVMLPTGIHCIGNASIEANLTLKLTPELVQELIFFWVELSRLTADSWTIHAIHLNAE